MNDNKVQKLSDKALDQVSGGGFITSGSLRDPKNRQAIKGTLIQRSQPETDPVDDDPLVQQYADSLKGGYDTRWLEALANYGKSSQN